MDELDLGNLKRPNLIFKYIRINDDTKNALKDSYLWFSTPVSLNDPFDLRWQFSDKWMKELLGRLIDKTEVGLAIKLKELGIPYDEEGVKGYTNILKNNVYITDWLTRYLIDGMGITVCSFTEKEDDILMWSHYADNHAGVCLMYSLENMPELFKRLYPVTYSDSYPMADTIEEVSTICALTKSSHWDYEQEWRVLAQEGGKCSIKKDTLKGIIFGCRTSAENVKELVKICDDADYSNLEFYRMIENSSEYKLEKMPMTPLRLR